MDVSQVEARITKKTKAIVPVHLAGQMTNMPALMEIASKHNLPVVEDSCQCILGNIDGKNAGTYGRSGAFSLHPLKNLNVWSDGGMIVTDDDDFATELRQLRNHGLAGRDSVVRMGCNSRLDSIQAVVGNWLIGQVDFITNTRIKNAAYLDRGAQPAFPASSCRSASTTGSWCSISTSCSPSAATSWSPIARSRASR